MNKKKIILFLLLSLLTFVICILCFSFIKYRHNIQVIKHFPTFSAWTIEGEELTIDTWDKTSYTCLVFFSPECSACKEKIRHIITLNYKNLRWLFLTPAPYEEVSLFIAENGLYGTSNATTLLLDHPALFTHYRIRNLPAFFLYGPDGELICRCKSGDSFERFLNQVNKWCRKE